MKFFLTAIFVLAMNKGLCSTNPMTGVMPPEGRAGRVTGAYDKREVLTILQPFDAMTKGAVGVAAFAGLRESEIAGLEWGDYNGDSITVSRSIDRADGRVNQTKTTASADMVPVIAPPRELLEAYRATVALGPDGKPMPDAPMFPSTRWHYADIDKIALLIIPPMMEAAGLKWGGWHASRRGLATLLN